MSRTKMLPCMVSSQPILWPMTTMILITSKSDPSVTPCLCIHRNFIGTMGTDWADVTTLFPGVWYQSCYHFPGVAMLQVTILERSPVFACRRMQPTPVSWRLWMCCWWIEEAETDGRLDAWGSPIERSWKRTILDEVYDWISNFYFFLMQSQAAIGLFFFMVDAKFNPSQSRPSTIISITHRGTWGV